MGRKLPPRKVAQQNVSTTHHINSKIYLLVAALVLAVAVTMRSWWREVSLVHKLRDEVKKAGGSVDCVELATFEGMRGLRSTCDLEIGSVVTFAPTRAMLSLLTADQHILDEVQSRSDGNPDIEIVKLVLVLLGELALGVRSLFAAYVASMPADPPDIIALGDDEQIKVMSSLLPKAEIRRDRMLQDISHLVIKSPDIFGNPSELEQRRAFSYVLSRAHMYTSGPTLTKLALIPFQDIANHDVHPNCDQICDAAGCKFIAIRRISRGDQLTHSYGAKSDLNLLYTYGFASGSSLSALHLSLNYSEESIAACGSGIALDRVAPLGLHSDSVECFQNAEGKQSFLEEVHRACSELHARLNRPSLHGILSIGRINPYQALEQLSARSPSLPLDKILDETVREELRTLQRCISESRQALR